MDTPYYLYEIFLPFLSLSHRLDYRSFSQPHRIHNHSNHYLQCRMLKPLMFGCLRVRCSYFYRWWNLRWSTITWDLWQRKQWKGSQKRIFPKQTERILSAVEMLPSKGGRCDVCNFILLPFKCISPKKWTFFRLLLAFKWSSAITCTAIRYILPWPGNSLIHRQVFAFLFSIFFRHTQHFVLDDIFIRKEKRRIRSSQKKNHSFAPLLTQHSQRWFAGQHGEIITIATGRCHKNDQKQLKKCFEWWNILHQ